MYQARAGSERSLEEFAAAWEEQERSRHARLLATLKHSLQSDVPLSSLPLSTPKSELKQQEVASTPTPSRLVSQQVAPQKVVQAPPRSQRRQFQEC